MIAYPVHYLAPKPARYSRLQLLVRLAASVALGILGLSLGLVYLAAFLALPAVAAVRLSAADAEAFRKDDAPRITRALAWFAAIYAWFALVVDALPSRLPDENVRIVVEPAGQPTASSALWRVVTGVPSALVLAFLACVGGLVWLWAALSVLFFEKVGDQAHAYLAGVQRWSVRLLAYQASLVDLYPPFGFADGEATLPEAVAR